MGQGSATKDLAQDRCECLAGSGTADTASDSESEEDTDVAVGVEAVGSGQVLVIDMSTVAKCQVVGLYEAGSTRANIDLPPSSRSHEGCALSRQVRGLTGSIESIKINNRMVVEAWRYGAWYTPKRDCQ